MVSTNDKGKKPEEDDPQNPKEEEILVRDEEDMEEDKHPNTRATVRSIGVVKPIKLKRTTQMYTRGKPPRLVFVPRSSPPRTKNSFHTLIHEHQYQQMPKGNLPSVWHLPRSNHVGKEHTNKEEWGNNSKNWDSRSDMIMIRIEKNLELIRTLTFE